MTPIDLNLGDLVMRGQILDSYPDPAELDQDILEVDLPNGITISVGWTPECDPEGHFCINAFDRYWANQVREELIATTSSEAVRIVQQLVRELAVPVTTVS